MDGRLEDLTYVKYNKLQKGIIYFHQGAIHDNAYFDNLTTHL
jgi:hypothetical protein